MTDLTNTVDIWLEAYGEPDVGRRTKLIEAVWSDGGTLADPPFAGRGRAEIGGLVDTALAHFPGHTFRRTSEVDAHHGYARYSWELVSPDGAVAVSGLDVVHVDDDGLLTHAVGFFGDLPARAA